MPKYMNDKDTKGSMYNTLSADATWWGEDCYLEAFFIDSGSTDPSKMRIRHTGIGTKRGPNPVVVRTGMK